MFLARMAQVSCFFRNAALSPISTGMAISRGRNEAYRPAKPSALLKVPREIVM